MGIATNYKPKVEVVSDVSALAQRTLEVFVAEANKAIAEKGSFFVAISGGHTPKHFFELLADAPDSKNLAWDKIELFWVDERYVEPDSQWSNYKLAADTFLKKVPIPEKNVHQIPTGYNDVKSAASHYEGAITEAFGLREKQLPEFDLMVLGMGADGHTGSMFPDSYATFDTEDLACVVYVLDEKLTRITLTHPVLCAAKHLVVLVSGKEKAAILKEVLTGEADEIQYPIHVLWPILDKVTWLVDEEAANLL